MIRLPRTGVPCAVLYALWIFFLLPLPAAVLAADATAPQGGIPDAYSSILQRGVLGGESGPSSPLQAAPVSSPYRLVGTLQGGGFSGAVLDDGTGAQTFYRVEQRLPDDSRIVKVMRDRVLIKRADGTVSELIVLDDVKAPAVSPNPTIGSTPTAPPVPEATVSDSGKRGVPRSQRRRQSTPEE